MLLEAGADYEATNEVFEIVSSGGGTMARAVGLGTCGIVAVVASVEAACIAIG